MHNLEKKGPTGEADLPHHASGTGYHCLSVKFRTCGARDPTSPPSTVDPEAWELRPLKHSVRWTIYVPRAMQEEIKRRAAAAGHHPSLLVQQALRRYLAEEKAP
jgi:hypothetical protein